MTTERAKRTEQAISHELPQLFCFPFAGGTASFFDQIEQDLAGATKATVNIVKFEYPGHGEHRKEPLCETISVLADDMFTRFRASYVGGIYALFGYSMGTIVLVEVLRRILASIYPAPKHIFLAAHEPKTIHEILSYASDELDDWVKARIMNLGTVPEQLRNNKTFWRIYLPIYRANYIMLAKYSFENLRFQTSIPATIFYSETDTPLKEMKLWENYFVGQVDYHKYEGQHFFIRQNHSAMAEVIRSKMAEVAA